MKNQELESTMRYSATCLCKSVMLDLSLPRGIDSYTPRKCDCDFCVERDLAYISGPEGRLKVSSIVPLNVLKQGSKQASFLQCSQCNQVVAVVYDFGQCLQGAVSASLFKEGFPLSEDQTVSPKLLSAEEKRARWERLWFSVEIESP